jgi:hypothetical protein
VVISHHEIATVAALLRNDNFRISVGAHPCGRMIAEWVRLLQMSFFVITRRPQVEVLIPHPEKASSRAKRGDLSTEKTITNKIATVAALLRNDNFCEPVDPVPRAILF